MRKLQAAVTRLPELKVNNPDGNVALETRIGIRFRNRGESKSGRFRVLPSVAERTAGGAEAYFHQQATNRRSSL